MNKLLKFITILFFFGFIFVIPITMLFSEDKKVSEIENKILTQLPKPTFESIMSKRFMKNFDTYTSDQFPFRSDFIKLKNSYSYIVGNREFRDIYIGKDGRLMEKYIFNKTIIDKNISQATNLSKHLLANYNIKSKLALIPTSIAFYFDELFPWEISDNQENVLNYIKKEINNSSSNLEFYTPYNILAKNKDKYIYFNNDHHYTQLGAKLTYNDMYNVDNEDLLKDYDKVSNNFYGSYYSKALLPFIKGDDIYAYKNYNDFNIKIDFSKEYNTLYDESKLSGKNKYQYFLHGDPSVAVINGNKNLNKEILVFKDSFAHSFVPFLTNNYSKIHIVDPRYYNLDLDNYLKENNNISEVLFFNNIQTFNSNELYKKLIN